MSAVEKRPDPAELIGYRTGVGGDLDDAPDHDQPLRPSDEDKAS